MGHIFIVGGAGGVARPLAKQLTCQGHQVTSLHRKPEQAELLKKLGATPVLGDLVKLESADLAELMNGCDVVVFSAGAGGAGVELTTAIDGEGLETSVEAAKLAGIKRFLLVSAFPESIRGQEPVHHAFEHYMKIKKQADVYLAATDLDWVILRPGTLSHDAGTAKINLGLAIPYGVVPREDVAATLAELIEQPAVNRVILELTQGDTPVAEAVAKIAR
ncbi:SDR family oxidoreductase [Celerinatantimonas sp. YJH-8]|uniref:SDR family oxidoreductase n=1 Tax=Celerinatantimonas sp. YJH-8 TaxID=3228714 RepID=UPI0038C6E1FF